MAAKYCPVSGRFKDCSNCQSYDCMDFFLYVIEDAKTKEDIRFILVNLNKLLINQTKTTIILDSFGSNLIPSLKDRYDYIIAQNMQEGRVQTALNFLLRQRKKAVLIIDNAIGVSMLYTAIKSMTQNSDGRKHYILDSSIPVRSITNPNRQKTKV